MKIIVDKEGNSIITQMIDAMFKAYGMAFFQDAKTIESNIVIKEEDDIEENQIN